MRNNIVRQINCLIKWSIYIFKQTLELISIKKGFDWEVSNINVRTSVRERERIIWFKSYNGLKKIREKKICFLLRINKIGYAGINERKICIIIRKKSG